MTGELNIAFYTWHFRKGYTKIFSYPSDYEVDRDDIEILFFMVLRARSRRLEAYYSTTKIKGKRYYWYYFGAFHRDPAILIVESDLKNTMPLLLLSAINLRLTNYNYILPFNEKFIPRALKNLKKSSDNVLLGLLANRISASLLELIAEYQGITVSQLLSKTENLEPTPTLIDLHEIFYILLHYGLIDMRFDEKRFDRTVKARKIILPLRYVDLGYLQSLKTKLRENYGIALQSIKKELRKLVDSMDYSEELSNMAKILLLDEYRQIIKKVYEKILIKRSNLTQGEALIYNELQKIGILDEIGNKVYLKTVPIIEIIDLKTKNEKILKPLDSLNVKLV
ncbi:MAG: hypothetical protein ACP6IP_05620 [Candidatus Njordarchaeia archaeon]